MCFPVRDVNTSRRNSVRFVVDDFPEMVGIRTFVGVGQNDNGLVIGVVSDKE